MVHLTLGWLCLVDGRLSGESPARLPADAGNGDTYGATVLVGGIVKRSSTSQGLGWKTLILRLAFGVIYGCCFSPWRHRRRDHLHTQALCLFVAPCKVALWAAYFYGSCRVVASFVWVIFFFSVFWLYIIFSLLIHLRQISCTRLSKKRYAFN
jgi:hypothetical protein